MYGFESLKDLFDVLLVPLAGGAIALMWPEYQARDRRKRFEALIVRELEEAGPYPKERNSKHSVWVDHQKKDFIHKRIIESPSENPEFILSLDPTLVYQISQLWDARRTSDGKQWLWYLQGLAERYKGEVGNVYREWKSLIESYQ